jgi:Fur family transcriptional regulator, ferric uptake regulator
MQLESPEQLSATARQAINTTGHRMTPQRALLLEIIQQSEEHLDAEEIHRIARDRGERISLSTVYRTLGLLKELQLVDELHLWDEHHHYESRTTHEHFHLLCRACGAVTEISGVVVEEMKGLASRQHEFSIERAEMDCVGLCRECLDAETRAGEVQGSTGGRG